MIRNAATLGGTPVPSRWRAARTGGRAGGAGWSTMGKAACRRVIPKYVTAFNAFDEWNQKKGSLTRIHHWNNRPGRGSKERKSSNSRLCSTSGHSCKSGCSAEEGRSGGSRTCLSKKGKSWRSRVSSSWENVPSDQYQV